MGVESWVGFGVFVFVIMFLVLTIWCLIKRSFGRFKPREVIFYGEDGQELRRFVYEELNLNSVKNTERSKLPINNSERQRQEQENATSLFIATGIMYDAVDDSRYKVESHTHEHSSCSSSSSTDSSSSSSCSSSSSNND